LDETQEQITARIVAQAATATASAVSEAASAAALVLAKENATVLTTIAVLGTEVNMIKNQQSSFESEVNRRMDNLDPKFEKIFNKLDNVALGRPTWATSLIMGSLFSLCVGLITYVLVAHG